MAVWTDLIATTSGSGRMLAPGPNGEGRGIKVEIGIPTTGSNIVGTAIVGTARIEAPSWVGLTDRFIGADVQLGSADGGNEVGTLQLVLDGSDGSLAPWNNAYAGPGTLVRLSSYYDVYPSSTTWPSASLWPGVSGWVPLITAVTESWNVNAISIDANIEVTITAVETASLLARVNDAALVAVVGGGETTTQRVQRLLDAAGWRYGFASVDTTNHTHQSTVMAQNRLTELYLTADSAGLVFRSNADGSAYLGPRSLAFIDVDATELVADGTLNIANDGDVVINSVALAIANDPAGEHTYTNGPLITQFGVLSFKRDDLNLTIGSSVADIAADILARGGEVMRVTSFVLDSTANYAAEETICTLRAGVGVNVFNIPGAPGVRCDACNVAQTSLAILPRGDNDVQMTATYSLLPSAMS